MQEQRSKREIQWKERKRPASAKETRTRKKKRKEKEKGIRAVKLGLTHALDSQKNPYVCPRSR